MSELDALFPDGSRFVHIKTLPYPNLRELYRVSITRYHPFRSRTYIASEAKVNTLLKLADYTVEAWGGNLEAHGMSRKNGA